MGPDGKRLAKRHGDTSLAHFRHQGVKPEVLVGYLAALAGLVPAGVSCMPGDLLEGFSMDRVPRDKVLGTNRFW